MAAQEVKKALSETPIGYLLAVLGGTLGGPLGWITSPVVLLILNNVMKGVGDKQPNRFLVWGLIGVIGAPVSLAPVMLGNKDIASKNGGSTQISTPQQENNSNRTEATVPQQADNNGVNLENYTKLQTGMSYQEVVAILGRPGEEMSTTNVAGYETTMYKWDGDKGFGANMNATFQNGKMMSKAQFGLK